MMGNVVKDMVADPQNPHWQSGRPELIDAANEIIERDLTIENLTPEMA